MKPKLLSNLGTILQKQADRQLSKDLDTLIRRFEKKDKFKIKGKVKTLRERTMYIHSKVEGILQDCVRITLMEDAFIFDVFADARSKLKFDTIFNEISFGALIKICSSYGLFQELPDDDKHKNLSEKKRIEKLNTLRNKLVHPSIFLKKGSSEIAKDYQDLVEAFSTALDMKARIFDKYLDELRRSKKNK